MILNARKDKKGSSIKLTSFHTGGVLHAYHHWLTVFTWLDPRQTIVDSIWASDVRVPYQQIYFLLHCKDYHRNGTDESKRKKVPYGPEPVRYCNKRNRMGSKDIKTTQHHVYRYCVLSTCPRRSFDWQNRPLNMLRMLGKVSGYPSTMYWLCWE